MSVTKMVLVPESLLSMNPVPKYINRLADQSQHILDQPGLSLDA